MQACHSGLAVLEAKIYQSSTNHNVIRFKTVNAAGLHFQGLLRCLFKVWTTFQHPILFKPTQGHQNGRLRSLYCSLPLCNCHFEGCFPKNGKILTVSYSRTAKNMSGENTHIQFSPPYPDLGVLIGMYCNWVHVWHRVYCTFKCICIACWAWNWCTYIKHLIADNFFLVKSVNTHLDAYLVALYFPPNFSSEIYYSVCTETTKNLIQLMNFCCSKL